MFWKKYDGQLEVAAKITLSEYTYNNFFIK